MAQTIPPEPDWGLRLVHEMTGGPDATQVGVDIVAVHGLGANPNYAWLRKKNDTYGMKSDVNWLTDLLPTTFREHRPSIIARIYCFNYNSKWLGKRLSQNRLMGVAGQLLHDLAAVNSSISVQKKSGVRIETPRPVIFVAHSFGGLVVQQAVVRASQPESQFHDFMQTFGGVIFLGTPHRGSAMQKWGSIMANLAGLIEYGETDLMDELDEKSMGSFDRVSQFMQILIYQGLAHAHAAVCFCENLPTDYSRRAGVVGSLARGYFTCMVVEEASAILPGLDHVVLDSDHLKLNKFWGFQDINYKRVVSVLSRISIGVTRLTAHRKKEVIEAVFGERTTDFVARELQLQKMTSRIESFVLSRLEFPGLTEREDEISDAYQKTFQWIYTDPKHGFVDFLRSGCGTYWISGKAGCGKSTLMKFLYTNEQTREHIPSVESELLVVGFFFHDMPGVPLLKSHVGLFRTVLHQILAKRKTLIPVVLPDLWRTAQQDYDLSGQPGNAYRWTLAELKRACINLMRQDVLKMHVLLLIDGLDEFEGIPEDLIDSLKPFNQPAKSTMTRVQVCLSSRPLRVFEIAFGDVPTLQVHKLTFDDIKQFVSAKFHADPIARELGGKEAVAANKLIREITSKADGVFLWVTIVVRSLLEGLRNADTVQDLRARLEQLPPDLDHLYQRILDRIEPFYQCQASEMLQIVLQAEGNMSLTGLQLAREGPSIALADQEPYRHGRNLQDAKRTLSVQLKTRCGGLIEVKYAHGRAKRVHAERPHGDPTSIQFLHLSVEEFLRKQTSQIWLTSHSPMDISELHLRLVASSMRQMKLHDVFRLRSSTHGDFVNQLLDMFVVHALKLERCTGRSWHEYLDALDAFGRTSNGLYWPQIRHEYEDAFAWKSDFMAYMISFGMRHYVLRKINTSYNVTAKVGRPLLFYALDPEFGIVRPYYARKADAIDLVTVRALLASGADPNQEYDVGRSYSEIESIDATTPWRIALWWSCTGLSRGIWMMARGPPEWYDSWGDNYMRDLRTNCLESLEALIEYGADVVTPFRRKSKGSYDFRVSPLALFNMAFSSFDDPHVQKVRQMLLDGGAEEYVEITKGLRAKEIKNMFGVPALRKALEQAGYQEPKSDSETASVSDGDVESSEIESDSSDEDEDSEWESVSSFNDGSDHS